MKKDALRDDFNSQKSSFKRLEGDLLSCLTSLFAVQEFKIYEDFLQISELVVIEQSFKNRSITPNESIYINYDMTNEFVNEYGIQYFDRPAILSEKVHAKGEEFNTVLRSFNLFYTDFWILGNSYNETLKIFSRRDKRCSEDSCYDKSLKEGRICHPGTFCLYY